LRSFLPTVLSMVKRLNASPRIPGTPTRTHQCRREILIPPFLLGDAILLRAVRPRQRFSANGHIVSHLPPKFLPPLRRRRRLHRLNILDRSPL
jgi:hypothetical protein